MPMPQPRNTSRSRPEHGASERTGPTGPTGPVLAPPFLGILMLQTRFPRPPGDIGCAQTWLRAGIAVRFLTVDGASPQRVVQQADRSLLAPFILAAQSLAAQGAALISTSCGFLAAYQDDLANAVATPVLSSSLLQCQHLRRPGILSIDACALQPAILAAAGVPHACPVQGVMPGSELHRRILNNEAELDLAEAERNVVAAALALVRRAPTVENIVLECTNMPPYRDAIAAATGRPVYDIETLLCSTWRALCSKA